MRILVTGSRDWDDRLTVYRALNRVVELNCWADYDSQNRLIAYNTSDLTIVHGGCPTGADHWADQWAVSEGLQPEVHHAQWSKHGKVAGPIRNEQMVRTGVDLCLAFIKNRSRGATSTMMAARRQGIETKVFRA